MVRSVACQVLGLLGFMPRPFLYVERAAVAAWGFLLQRVVCAQIDLSVA